MQGDSAGLRAALRTFLDNYEEEIAAGKPEYNEHRRGLDTLLGEARRTLGITDAD